jgi:CheY-like chemotaxis protein
MLKSIGLDSKCYSSGRLAIQALEQGESFELALIDIQMPEMNGWEVAQEIHKLFHSKTRAFPLIAFSGDASGEDLDKSKSVGFSEHWQKPIRKSVLNQELQKYGLTGVGA